MFRVQKRGIGLGYKMDNNNDKAKYECKIKNESYKRIRRYLIVNLEEYII